MSNRLGACACRPVVRGMPMLDAAGVRKVDPTGTSSIRARLRGRVEKRFAMVRKLTREHLVAQDALGLAGATARAIEVAALARARGEAPADALAQFQAWFDEALLKLVLADKNWLWPDVLAAYMRGYDRAVAALPGVRVAPLDSNRARVVASLAVMELQGIMEVVSQLAVRAAATALVGRTSPLEAYREVADRIDRIGVVRGRAMANSMVVKAHATGTLDALKGAGVTRVGIVPEYKRRVRKTTTTLDAMFDASPARSGRAESISRLRTRGGEELVNILNADDPCQECVDLAEDGPYEIDEAHDLIPAHPNCMCAFTPALDARFAGGAE